MLNHSLHKAVAIRLLIASVLLCPCLAVSESYANDSARGTWYVSPDGSDDNDGSADRPFASIERAQKAVRQAIAAGLARDVTVILRGGTYVVSEPLRLTAADSGTDQHSVTYRAAPEEIPVISGGRVISGWEPGENGIWKTHVPDALQGRWAFRELFVDGRRAARARHPNEGWFRIAQVGPDRRTSFYYGDADLKSWPDTHQIEMLFLHDWSVSRVLLRDVDPSSHRVVLQHPIGAGDRGFWVMNGFEPHPRYALENGAALLDEPGEWQLDWATGNLRYWPLPSEDMRQARVVAPFSEGLLMVTGGEDDGTFVRNLHFEGIAFEYSRFDLKPANRYAGIQAAFHQRGPEKQRQAVPAAIHFRRARQCSMHRCVVRHIGGSGVWFGEQCSRCSIEESVVRDVSANGIMIGEDRMRQVDGRPWWESAPQQVATENTVRSCLVEEVGRQFHGAVGIWGGIVAETVLEQNLVRNTPYTGISIGWMWNPQPTPCRANRIERNHIHHVMQILSDGGGIYTLGLQPNSVIRGNCIHDVRRNAGRAESNGMFLDEGTTDYTIENNTLYNVARSPLRFHQATHNVVQNNVFVIRGDVPEIRYNRTAEEDIVKKSNRTIRLAEESSDLPSEARRAIDEAMRQAGPAREALQRLESLK